MYVVTGAAGFIGSNLVRALHARGGSVFAVDDLRSGDKFRNLADTTIADYMDREEFSEALNRDALPHDLRAIFHQGAITDTTESDGRRMMAENFTFSKKLLSFALKKRVPFVYASSAAIYGAGRSFHERPEDERPINVYGYSKLAFDQHVRTHWARAESTVVGLRYFNVYGPRERAKGRMASMVYQLYRQLSETGKARLFEGTDGYGPGEQRRDFVFVGDVVKVNLFFAESPAHKGIFNLGTGKSRTFNDVANTLIATLGRGRVEYIPFPEALAGKYQSFTEADLTALRGAGYDRPFADLAEGVAESVQAWKTEAQ